MKKDKATGVFENNINCVRKWYLKINKFGNGSKCADNFGTLFLTTIRSDGEDLSYKSFFKHS